jgi:hypothetical protein
MGNNKPCDNETIFFKDIAKAGVFYFQEIYLEPNKKNIAKFLKITSFFPKFVLEEALDLNRGSVRKRVIISSIIF